MNIRIINFQTLVANYTSFRDGYNDLIKLRNTLLDELEPIRKEAKEIIYKLQTEPSEYLENTFRDIQEELIILDDGFKKRINEENDNLNDRCFNELSEIVKEWSLDKDIDMIIGEMEVIYHKDWIDITDDIIDFMKERDLYTEFKEEDFHEYK